MFQVNAKIDRRFLSSENLIKIEKDFFMPLPFSATILFTDYEVEKMKRILDFSQKENMFKCSFYAGWYARDVHKSERITILDKELNPIEIKQYEDFNRKFNVFDNKFFRVYTSTSDKSSFKIQLIYVNGWSEHVFKTLDFSISDLIEVPNNY